MRTPLSFANHVLTEHEMTAQSGYSREQLQKFITEGQIPPGVKIPGSPWMFWHRGEIRKWCEAGCPANTVFENHQEKVHQALIKCLEAEDNPAQDADHN